MLIHWLWFAELAGLQDEKKLELLRHFSDAEDIWQATRAELKNVECLSEEELGLLENRELSEAEHIWRICREKQIRVLTYGDAAYPERLRQIPDPPMVLYYQGIWPEFDKLPVIGVVGTRKATPYGMEMSRKLGYQISRCGGLVVSGGAAGIDTRALEGALSAGEPTAAILGNGVDVVFPAANRSLFQKIQQSGCLISEYPPGTPGYKWNFPRRNRIISGLSCGILVVEAPAKSGALITAELAMEQGRDVFVVTGNGDSPNCAGSNNLLRKGGIYADCGWDILSEYQNLFPERIQRDDSLPGLLPLNPEKEKIVAQKPKIPEISGDNPGIKQKKDKKAIDKQTDSTYSDCVDNPIGLTETEQKVLMSIQGECLVDDVVANSGLSSGVVIGALTMLELKGVIARLPGRRVCRNG